MEQLLDQIFDDIIEDDYFFALIDQTVSQTPGLLCQIITYDGRIVPAEPSFTIPAERQKEFLDLAGKHHAAHYFDDENSLLVLALDLPPQAAVVTVALPSSTAEAPAKSNLLQLLTNTIQLAIHALEVKESQLEKQQLENQIEVLVRQHSQLVEDNHQQYLQIGEQEKQYAKQLEKEIAEQTKDLRDANKKLRKAGKLKNEFLANMSHELRTPMNAIIGFADLLSSTKLTNEQQEYVQTLISSGQGLLVLINEILDLAKIEAGKLEIEEIPFELKPLLKEIISLLKSQAAEKKNNLILHIDKGVPEAIIGDPNRLRQILINLLGNALKFTKEGEVKLLVESHPGETPQTRLINFFVQDTGIGIPSEKQPKVFEKFTQADGSTTREYGGTGLGLSICQQLVGLMKGTIKLDSTVGQGSTFSFKVLFRLAMDEKIVKPSIPKPEAQKIDANTAEHGKIILIVEDNPVNQRLATIMVKKQGFEVIVAGDGLEAISVLEKNKVDLILMDIQMPNMDGLTATKKIREIESTGDKKNYPSLADRSGAIPIIALSAHVREEDQQQGREAGMDDFLTKPIIKTKLTEVLKKAF